MGKTKTLATLAKDAKAPAMSQGRASHARYFAPGLLIARSTQSYVDLPNERATKAHKRPLDFLLLQRAAAPGARKPTGIHDLSGETGRAQVNQSADVVAAGVVPTGKNISAGHVEAVPPSAVYAPPQGMELKCFLRRDGTAIKFAGLAGGIHLSRERTQAEYGPLLTQAQAAFMVHAASATSVSRADSNPVHRQADASGLQAEHELSPLGKALATGSGRPMDSGSRRKFERAFDADLSAVRIHTDSSADRAAQAVHAYAFATGSDIYFRAGLYQPNSSNGQRLLAHEVAHTVQQSAGAHHLSTSSEPGAVHISEPGDPLEREAETAADKALRDEIAPVHASGPAPGHPLLSRKTVSAKNTSVPSSVKSKKDSESPGPQPTHLGGGTLPQREAGVVPVPSSRKGTAPKSASPGSGKKGETKDTPAPKKPGAHARAKGDAHPRRHKESRASGKRAESGALTKKPEGEERAHGDTGSGLQEVIDQIRSASHEQKRHPSAEAKAAEAKASAHGPKNEVEAEAKHQHVEGMAQQAPGKFDRESFKKALRDVIEKIEFNDAKQAQAFKEQGGTKAVKDTVQGQVQEGKAAASGGLAGKTEEAPNTAGIAPTQGTDLPAVDPGDAPHVDAAQAVPTPKQDRDVSLQTASQALDQRMAQGKLTPEQMQKSNEPVFQKALADRKTAQDHAVAAPAAFRKDEQATITGARSAAVASTQTHLAGMHGKRTELLGAVKGLQEAGKNKHEETRARLSAQFENIYAQTKTKVEDRLKRLDEEVSQVFDEGATAAQETFESFVSWELFKWAAQRYLASGGLLAIWDAFVGWPPEVNEYYKKGRNVFIAEMEAVIDRVATVVETGLNEAIALVAEGKRQIDEEVAHLPLDERAVGEEAAKGIHRRFADLEKTIEDRQTQLIDSLALKYAAALKKVDDRIAEMQAASRGLIAKALEGLNSVLEIVDNMRKLLLGLLAKAGDALDLILADPVGFLSNLVAGVKQGFLNFVANIGGYLKQGLLDWLFGALAEAGLQMPKQFDLAGILDLVLQVLGLTYKNIRRRAVKILGEKVVAALETGAEIFIALITKGPAGLWEWIKDKANALITTVLDGIKTFVMESVIKAGVTWIVGLLNPASAFIKACKAIYDIVMFFVERGQQILALVNAILDSVIAIAKGQVGVAAQFVEASLAKTVPVFIGFLASLLGLGGISETIKSIIEKIQEPVNAVIDWVITKAAQMVKAVGKMLGFGKDETKPDERTPEEKERDLNSAVSEANTVVSDKRITAAAARDKFEKIRGKYRLKTLDLIEDEKEAGEEKVHVVGEINPSLSGPPYVIIDVEIPTYESGEFDAWFTNLSDELFEALINHEESKEKIGQGLRGRGGEHEFLTVSTVKTWRKWGITVTDMRQQFTVSIEWLNAALAKGWRHSTGGREPAPNDQTAHNELHAIIRKSSGLNEFWKNFDNWAKRWLHEDEQWPSGLRPQ